MLVQNVEDVPVVCGAEEVDVVCKQVEAVVNGCYQTTVFESCVKDLGGGQQLVSYRVRPDAKPADVLQAELRIAESVEWAAVGFWS